MKISLMKLIYKRILKLKIREKIIVRTSLKMKMKMKMMKEIAMMVSVYKRQKISDIVIDTVQQGNHNHNNKKMKPKNTILDWLLGNTACSEWL